MKGGAVSETLVSVYACCSILGKPGRVFLPLKALYDLCLLSFPSLTSFPNFLLAYSD